MTDKGKAAEAKSDVKLVTALLVFALLGLSAFLGDVWADTPEGEESLADVTGAVFGEFVFAFELLSALLLAALVGAVVVAMREREVA